MRCFLLLFGIRIHSAKNPAIGDAEIPLPFSVSISTEGGGKLVVKYKDCEITHMFDSETERESSELDKIFYEKINNLLFKKYFNKL
jgi:hypothetical protein